MIAKISGFNSIDASVYRSLCFCIAKLLAPLGKDVHVFLCEVVANSVQAKIIVYKRIIDKGVGSGWRWHDVE